MSAVLATAVATRGKSPEAFRTISEVSVELDVPQHVLRFWETRFAQVRPVKRAGGRRFYRPEDVALLRGIRALLYSDGYTIKGVQKVLRDRGYRFVADLGRNAAGTASTGGAWHALGACLSGDDAADDAMDEDLGVSGATGHRSAAPDGLGARPDTAMATLMRVHADAAERIALEEHKRVRLELLLAELLVLRDRLRVARRAGA
ncbi:MAG: MerR family transcriptional regulator [Rhizomicrobium sp.]